MSRLFNLLARWLTTSEPTQEERERVCRLKALERSEKTLAIVSRAAFGKSGGPLTVHRKNAAALLREMRAAGEALKSTRERREAGLRIAAHVHGWMLRKGFGWWRWCDDFAAGRSPVDFSQAAREARKLERVARLLDGSLADCAAAACPPAPAEKFFTIAKLILKPIEKEPKLHV